MNPPPPPFKTAFVYTGPVEMLSKWYFAKKLNKKHIMTSSNTPPKQIALLPVVTTIDIPQR